MVPPIFEIGLKGYCYGRDAVELAVAADRASQRYRVQVIFDPQLVDLPACVEATEQLLIFAQHMDAVEVGPGCGAVLPEALKQAGAHGTLLNHAERRLTLRDIRLTIQRAREVGLLTLVCADSPTEAAAIAQLGPDTILAEPPELIGTGRSVGTAGGDFIKQSQKMIKSVNPGIIVFNSAGIRTPQDVYDIIMRGAEATGSTSGIVKSADPVNTLTAMIKAVRDAWDARHPHAAGGAGNREAPGKEAP